MAKSLWTEKESEAFIKLYGSSCGEDLALRVYTSRLIGRDSNLVLHGGGNTSVKTKYTNIFGKEEDAIYVKGSGWDLVNIEPAGLPALNLDYLKTLIALDRLSDEQMVNEIRTHLYDANSPTPSVETLLHAFIPQKYIDHSHADAILALTNNRDCEEFVQSCFEGQLIIVPYVMPGFALAKLAAQLYQDSPNKHGMLLLKHGLFSWGRTAKESYERHVEFVAKAEEFLESRASRSDRGKQRKKESAAKDVLQMLPVIRGTLTPRTEAGQVSKRFILRVRNSPQISSFLERTDLKEISETAPLTPDHIIRTKQFPLTLDLKGNESEIKAQIEELVNCYTSSYKEYFKRCANNRNSSAKILDTSPRILLIPGVGLVGVGESAKSAEIALDISEHTIKVKDLVDRVSRYEGLSELDLFDVEYWSLEQAKLGAQKPKPLAGQVAVISGGAGAVGIGIARVLKEAGAEVAIADLNKYEELGKELGVFGVEMDVTDEASVKGALAKICERFGGIDILIPNAGLASSAPIENIESSTAKRLIDVNFHGVFLLVREGGKVLKRQGTGGNIVIISSKNVFAPGKEFSIYSASKAACHQFGKVAALEYAPFGIRVNMITPDAVFSAGSHPSGLWQSVGPSRAEAHGIKNSDLPEFYRNRNLLKSRISAEDVGRAVLFFATNQTPTTGASLPVDGGIAEAFPR